MEKFDSNDSSDLSDWCHRFVASLGWTYFGQCLKFHTWTIPSEKVFSTTALFFGRSVRHSSYAQLAVSWCSYHKSDHIMTGRSFTVQTLTLTVSHWCNGLFVLKQAFIRCSSSRKPESSWQEISWFLRHNEKRIIKWRGSKQVFLLVGNLEGAIFAIYGCKSICYIMII